MPSWKKVIVSGSQAHLQGITASNLTNTTTGQIVGYSPTTGILSYFNTSSIVVATASYALTASFINPIGTNAFVQNGNSFGAAAVLGTNDSQSLIFETNGTQKAIIAPSGYTKFNYATNDGTQAFGVINTNISESLALSGYNIWSGSNDNNDVVTGQFVYTGDNYNNDNIRQTLILGQPALGVVSGVATRPSRIAIIANTTQEPGLIGFNSASIDFIIGSKNTGRMLQIKSGSVGIGMGATDLDNTTRLRLRGSGTTSTTTALRVENSSAAATLVVRDDGTVGIGTNLPSAELHISGASADSLLRVGSPTQANILFVTGSGNVGIGTSTPTNTLQVSGSLWATTITASNIPSASNANFLLYNSASGEFTYQSTSSIGNVQGTGTANHVTYWTGTNTVAGNATFQFNPNVSGRALLTLSGDIDCGDLSVGAAMVGRGNLTVNLNTTLGSAPRTASINTGRVNIPNLTAGSSELAVLVTGSDGQVFTRAIDNRVFGTSLVDATNGADNRIATFTDADSITGENDLTFNGTTFAVSTGFTATTAGAVNAASITTTGNVVVGGDLTVNGDTTIINTSTLSVEDKFIVLGRSSGSQIPASEGGIIVEGAGGSGSAFVFNSGSGANVSNRWGIATNVPTGSTNVTPTDFMVSVSQSAAAPLDANPPSYGGSAGGFGNMYIQTTGEIWIYS